MVSGGIFAQNIPEIKLYTNNLCLYLNPNCPIPSGSIVHGFLEQTIRDYGQEYVFGPVLFITN